MFDKLHLVWKFDQRPKRIKTRWGIAINYKDSRTGFEKKPKMI
jgi:hypothetical protein